MYSAPKRCPRCRYERSVSESAPDWQCPSCGVAYSKVEAGTDLRPASAHAATHSHGSVRRRWPALGLLVMLAAAGLYVLLDQQSGRGSVGAAHGAQPDVVMYASSWCGYCAKARTFFAHHGIDYVELDVERDSEAAQINQRLGGGGVPTILVGEALVHGFDERKLADLLDPWLK